MNKEKLKDIVCILLGDEVSRFGEEDVIRRLHFVCDCNINEILDLGCFTEKTVDEVFEDICEEGDDYEE